MSSCSILLLALPFECAVVLFAPSAGALNHFEIAIPASLVPNYTESFRRELLLAVGSFGFELELIFSAKKILAQ